MLTTRYNWLRWDDDGKQYTLDMDGIKGTKFTPANGDGAAMLDICMGEGARYIMFGEYAEKFNAWRWVTSGEGAFKVGDLDLP
jgi:hypothetical protein